MPDLWSTTRRSTRSAGSKTDHRHPFEHDYDRLLFSTPVRRLADKTQVFALDRNDGVRTRLTHSHEVANLARSMGFRLLHEGFEFDGTDARQIGAILSAIGLAHDLGNPPFGHQGEAAISHWFKRNQDFFASDSDDLGIVPEHLWPEFLEFEGNAQTFRILTRLQVGIGRVGLDWTAATLNAILKYPTPCDKRDAKNAAKKKYGFFESEYSIVQWMHSETGVQLGQRHPLTWLMEAADDIAYSTLDIEDAIRKGIISPDDVHAFIEHSLSSKYPEACIFITEKFKSVRDEKMSISETREIMSAYLRTAFISTLIKEAIDSFRANSAAIFAYQHTTPILKQSDLLESLKDTAKKQVFAHRDVRKIEAEGYEIIGDLMDFYWHAISQREDPKSLTSHSLDAKSAYGISKISDNYLQCAERGGWMDRNGIELPLRYRELRLLTDMIAGMTDGFAKYEHEQLRSGGLI